MGAVMQLVAEDATLMNNLKVRLARFGRTHLKVGMPKSKDFDSFARGVYDTRLGLTIPAAEKRASLFDIIPNNSGTEVGVIYGRHLDVCRLVAMGSVDAAVVGRDILLESGLADSVTVVESYPQTSWQVVIAAVKSGDITSVDHIRRVVTRYPNLTKQFFAQRKQSVEIIPVIGSTEIYPYLPFAGGRVDAIIEVSVTGRTLQQLALRVLGEPLLEVYPLLITTKDYDISPYLATPQLSTT